MNTFFLAEKNHFILNQQIWNVFTVLFVHKISFKDIICHTNLKYLTLMHFCHQRHFSFYLWDVVSPSGVKNKLLKTMTAELV